MIHLAKTDDEWFVSRCGKRLDKPRPVHHVDTIIFGKKSFGEVVRLQEHDEICKRCLKFFSRSANDQAHD